MTCGRLVDFSEYSTNKSDRHNITEILLKMAINTINHLHEIIMRFTHQYDLSLVKYDVSNVVLTIGIGITSYAKHIGCTGVAMQNILVYRCSKLPQFILCYKSQFCLLFKIISKFAIFPFISQNGGESYV